MALPIRDFFAVPRGRPNLDWIKKALQNAIELEWSTIPPYLTAMWSIINQGDDVADSLKTIVLQEMFHMGVACNLLTTLGGTPRIAHPSVVPTFPGPLPGEIHVGLIVPLRRLSKRLIRLKFMTIEQPSDSDFHWCLGRRYKTIGAFYDAIYDAICDLPDSAFLGTRQREVVHYMYLPKIETKTQALSLVLKVKEQGEGAVDSPMSDGGLAHYFRFGEMWHERRYVQEDDEWDYLGPPLRLPTVKCGEVYSMAPVPRGGYPGVSDKFDRAYSDVLRDMEASWATTSDGEGQRLLNRAMLSMKDNLPVLATELMKKRVTSRRVATYGPSFRYIPK